MRKILFGIAIVILLIFTGVVMYQGTDNGLNVWGFTDIQEENDIIDRKNSQLATLVNNTYPSTLATLNTSATTLEKTKKEYEDQSILLANSKYYKQVENYQNEFILIKVGNYADDNNVEIRTVVTKSDVAGLYDINFTIMGEYPNVTDYIYDIENDSKLGFKIENFIMRPANVVSQYNGSPNSSVTTFTSNEAAIVGTDEQVTANFNCKEISIDLKWLDENESIIPGIITRNNPYINDMTTLTGEYSNQTLTTQQTTTNTNNVENTNATTDTTNTTTRENTTNDSVYNTSVKEVDNRKDTNEPSASDVIDNMTAQN